MSDQHSVRHDQRREDPPELQSIRIQRGQLAGGDWGYDILFDGEKVNHVGSLPIAEAYAQGYAAGLHRGNGGDVEVRIGPEGLSTERADLEPEALAEKYERLANEAGDEPTAAGYRGLAKQAREGKLSIQQGLKSRDYTTGPNRDEEPRDVYTGDPLDL